MVATPGSASSKEQVRLYFNDDDDEEEDDNDGDKDTTAAVADIIENTNNTNDNNDSVKKRCRTRSSNTAAAASEEEDGDDDDAQDVKISSEGDHGNSGSGDGEGTVKGNAEDEEEKEKGTTPVTVVVSAVAADDTITEDKKQDDTGNDNDNNETKQTTTKETTTATATTSVGIGSGIQQQDIHANDVLCGRGRGVNFDHPGNVQYRDILLAKKKIRVPKDRKRALATTIVQEIRARVPPGRFLKKHQAPPTVGGGDEDGDEDEEEEAELLWFDIGDERAIFKTMQGLREQWKDEEKDKDTDSDNEEEYYSVQEILDRKIIIPIPGEDEEDGPAGAPTNKSTSKSSSSSGCYLYQLRWVGYPKKGYEDTWEPPDNLDANVLEQALRKFPPHTYLGGHVIDTTTNTILQPKQEKNQDGVEDCVSTNDDPIVVDDDDNPNTDRVSSSSSSSLVAVGTVVKKLAGDGKDEKEERNKDKAKPKKKEVKTIEQDQEEKKKNADNADRSVVVSVTPAVVQKQDILCSNGMNLGFPSTRKHTEIHEGNLRLQKMMKQYKTKLFCQYDISGSSSISSSTRKHIDSCSVVLNDTDRAKIAKEIMKELLGVEMTLVDDDNDNSNNGDSSNINTKMEDDRKEGTDDKEEEKVVTGKRPRDESNGKKENGDEGDKETKETVSEEITQQAEQSSSTMTTTETKQDSMDNDDKKQHQPVVRFLSFKSMKNPLYENLGTDFVWEVLTEEQALVKICQNMNYIFMSDTEREALKVKQTREQELRAQVQTDKNNLQRKLAGQVDPTVLQCVAAVAGPEAGTRLQNYNQQQRITMMGASPPNVIPIAPGARHPVAAAAASAVGLGQQPHLLMQQYAIQQKRNHMQELMQQQQHQHRLQMIAMGNASPPIISSPSVMMNYANYQYPQQQLYTVNPIQPSGTNISKQKTPSKAADARTENGAASIVSLQQLYAANPIAPRETKIKPKKQPSATTNETTGIIEGRVRIRKNSMGVGSSGGKKTKKSNSDGSKVVTEHDIVLFDKVEAGRTNAGEVDKSELTDKYYIINDVGTYRLNIGNEKLVKAIVRSKSDYDIHQNLAKYTKKVMSSVVGRFLYRSALLGNKNDDSDSDDDDDESLETPTAEATNKAIQDGEDALARAEAALKGEKSPSPKKKGNDNDNDDDDGDNNNAIVWEVLTDQKLIKKIVYLCVKDILTLSNERKKGKLNKKKKAKEKRKRKREQERVQNEQQVEWVRVPQQQSQQQIAQQMEWARVQQQQQLAVQQQIFQQQQQQQTRYQQQMFLNKMYSPQQQLPPPQQQAQYNSLMTPTTVPMQYPYAAYGAMGGVVAGSTIPYYSPLLPSPFIAAQQPQPQPDILSNLGAKQGTKRKSRYGPRGKYKKKIKNIDTESSPTKRENNNTDTNATEIPGIVII